MRRKLSFFKRSLPVEGLIPLMEQWFENELGASVLASEQQLLDEPLSRCFGYHLLQLSVDRHQLLFENCRVQRKFRASPGLDSLQTDVITEFEALPFETDSIDVVILHHVHEYTDNPHTLLREIQRVVVPHGHVIIAGFNPWSLLGLRHLAGRFQKRSIWNNHLLTSGRIVDWLGLLGFQVENIDYGFHRLPVTSINKLLSSNREYSLLKRLPLGGIYVITAIKQVANVTPVKPLWRTNKGFAGLSPVKPRIPVNRDANYNTDIQHTDEEVA